MSSHLQISKKQPVGEQLVKLILTPQEPGPSFSKHLKSVTMLTSLSSKFPVLSFTCIGIYFARIKRKHKLHSIMKFESSNIVFHEIIEVRIFLAQQITTKTDFRCFEKLVQDSAGTVHFLSSF